MHGSENPKDEDKPSIDIDLLLPFQISQLNAKLAAQARAIIARHGTLSLPEWRIIRRRRGWVWRRDRPRYAKPPASTRASSRVR
jgi:hypothetical protein